MTFRLYRLLAIWFASLAAVVSSTQAATLLVANKSDHTVDLLDLTSGESVATLPTGKGPHEITTSADGHLAAISNYGDRDQPGSTLTVVDVAEARVLKTIELARHTRPHGLAWVGDSRIAVTAEGSAHLLFVDIDSGQILSEVETGQSVSHMLAVVKSADRAFVANIGSGTVTVIDLKTVSKLTDLETGEGAEGIAASPDGSEVWVGNRGADTLSVIDPHTLKILATIPCPGFPIRVTFAAGGERVLISAARSGEVVLFDTRQRRELLRRRLDLSNAPDASRRLFGDQFGDSPVPVGLVIDPAGGSAWVAATQADVVVVVEVETLMVQDVLRAGREPDGMAFSPIAVRAAARKRPPRSAR